MSIFQFRFCRLPANTLYNRKRTIRWQHVNRKVHTATTPAHPSCAGVLVPVIFGPAASASDVIVQLLIVFSPLLSFHKCWLTNCMFGSTLNYCKNADSFLRQETSIFRIFPPLPRLTGDTRPGEAGAYSKYSWGNFKFSLGYSKPAIFISKYYKNYTGGISIV